MRNSCPWSQSVIPLNVRGWWGSKHMRTYLEATCRHNHCADATGKYKHPGKAEMCLTLQGFLLTLPLFQLDLNIFHVVFQVFQAAWISISFWWNFIEPNEAEVGGLGVGDRGCIRASWWIQHRSQSIENSRESSYKAHVVVSGPCKMLQSGDIVHQAWKIEMTL